MNHPRIRYIIIAFALAAVLMLPAHTIVAQTSTDTTKNAPSDAIKLFVDSPVDDDYLKTEITFVDFVRDRALADVHILVSSLNTASGGKEYTITFLGQRRFEGMADTLKYFSKESDTEDKLRKGLVKIMMMGLVRYASRTSLSPQLNISFSTQEKPQPKIDKWNHWVFTLSGNGYLNGEKGYRYHNLWGSITANRVTQKFKLNMTLYGAETRDVFEYDDSEIKSFSDNKSFQITPVFAIDDHWSWLVNAAGGSSTYSNRSGYLLGALGLEYNIFPYSQSTRRVLRLDYDASVRTIKYYEETIYDRTTESRWQQSLSATLELIQPWGSWETEVSFSHYLHDFDKNRLEIWCDLSLRIVKGLSLSLQGGYSKIHDLIGLPKGGATQEEVLLRRAQLETSYSYWTSIGLSYSFGSIYSDIVNPRFGD
jgi:hypothetical protein